MKKKFKIKKNEFLKILLEGKETFLTSIQKENFEINEQIIKKTEVIYDYKDKNFIELNYEKLKKLGLLIE